MPEPSESGGSLRTTVSRLNGCQVVTLVGDLDAGTAVELRRQLVSLLEGGATSIVFELAELEFVDSTGLGVLVGTQKRLHQRDGNLVLRSLRPSARKAFEITGLDRVFEIE